MLKAYFKPQNGIMASDSLLNSTGSVTSYATNQVFTTTANSSYKKQLLLPVCNDVSEPGLCSGTAMVIQQPRDLQWQNNCVSNLQNCNAIRCLQKGFRGRIVRKCQHGVSGPSRSQNSISMLFWNC